jgi:hypothetical protein
MQTLKSALDDRVRNDRANREYAARYNTGEGIFCPAGSGDLNYDVYGRPVNTKTLNLNDASCSNYTDISATRYLSYENNNRPYLPVSGAGSRGYADTMFKGRDIWPKDVYDTGKVSDFHNYYPASPNNGPPPQMTYDSMQFQYPVPYRGFSMSHDTGTGWYRYKG